MVSFALAALAWGAVPLAPGPTVLYLLVGPTLALTLYLAL